MKKWLYPAAALAAVAVLSRLPHPATDIARLKPVRAVYLYLDRGGLSMETDTGDSGSGADLTEAYLDMRSRADGEIFLDTAEFLILDPSVQITDAFYGVFRPTCAVVRIESKPDMETVCGYLSAHRCETTLAYLRASMPVRK